MTTRKQIRDSIKLLVESALPSVPVYTSRMVDVTDKDSYVQIYFGEGEVFDDGRLSPHFQANIIVVYGAVSATDDVLDSAMGIVHSAISSNDGDVLRAELVAIGAEPVSSFYRSGFEYGNADQVQHNTLQYNYQIVYSD